jgi:hypothetical protein
MREKDKKFTWNDLKKFVSEIPEEFLGQEVIWWGDERGGKITFTELLEEDYVNYGEGMEPSSIYKDLDDYKGVTPDAIMKKGTPILNVD